MSVTSVRCSFHSCSGVVYSSSVRSLGRLWRSSMISAVPNPVWKRQQQETRVHTLIMRFCKMDGYCFESGTIHCQFQGFQETNEILVTIKFEIQVCNESRDPSVRNFLRKTQNYHTCIWVCCASYRIIEVFIPDKGRSFCWRRLSWDRLRRGRLCCHGETAAPSSGWSRRTLNASLRKFDCNNNWKLLYWSFRWLRS